MLLELKRIAEARDARAAEGRSLAERALRGAGNLLLGAAKHVFDGILEDGPRMAARTAARTLAGHSGAANPGAASTAMLNFLAAHSRRGPAHQGHRPGLTDDDRMERNLRAMEREVRSLPLRDGQPGQHRWRPDGTDSEED